MVFTPVCHSHLSLAVVRLPESHFVLKRWYQPKLCTTELWTNTWVLFALIDDTCAPLQTKTTRAWSAKAKKVLQNRQSVDVTRINFWHSLKTPCWELEFCWSPLGGLRPWTERIIRLSGCSARGRGLSELKPLLNGAWISWFSLQKTPHVSTLVESWVAQNIRTYYWRSFPVGKTHLVQIAFIHCDE